MPASASLAEPKPPEASTAHRARASATLVADVGSARSGRSAEQPGSASTAGVRRSARGVSRAKWTRTQGVAGQLHARHRRGELCGPSKAGASAAGSAEGLGTTG